MNTLRPSASSSATRGAIGAGAAFFLVLLVIVLGTVFVVIGKYNGIVTADEKVDASWSEIDNQYQRRFELIPQLLETVKGAANFEKEVLTEVTEARASVSQFKLPEGAPADAAQLQKYIEAQKGLGAALTRLFAVAEAYPELKATQNFLTLQDQLEGTENRIAVARRDYIDAVFKYNGGIKRFPGNIIASSFNFEEKAQLTIDEAQRKVPPVEFDFGKDE